MKELSIYRPMYTKKLTQGFGENKACIKTNILKQPYRPFQVVGAYNNGLCPLGSIPFYPAIGLKGHNGLDLGAWMREPIFHNGNYEGTAYTHIDADGGRGVDIVSNEKIFEYKGEMHYFKIRHWHCQEIMVHDGQQVKIGQPIALAGTTGASNGVHDHMGGKPCHKDGRALDTNNGYYGAVDITPFYYHEIMVRETLGLSQEKLDTAQKVARVVYSFRGALNSILNK